VLCGASVEDGVPPNDHPAKNDERRVQMAQTTTATKLVPLGDRVVLRPKQKEEVTKSGIVLPDTAREKPQEGEVIAVGPGRVLDNGQRLDMELKVGQTVLYAKYAGTEFKLEDEEYLIVREPDVLAVVSE
jgi:chaperonin GroES